MQEYFFDADTVIAGCLDPFDVIDNGRKLTFVKRQNPVLDILRRHAVIGPDNGDDRNVDFRKDVDRHTRRGPDAEQRDQDQA